MHGGGVMINHCVNCQQEVTLSGPCPYCGAFNLVRREDPIHTIMGFPLSKGDLIPEDTDLTIKFGSLNEYRVNLYKMSWNELYELVLPVVRSAGLEDDIAVHITDKVFTDKEILKGLLAFALDSHTASMLIRLAGDNEYE